MRRPAVLPVLVLGTCIPTAAPLRAASPPSSAAKLNHVRGPALVRRSLLGSFVTPGFSGMLLYAGNVIQTELNGFADILFRDKRRVILPGQSAVELSTNDPSRVRVLRGPVRMRVRHGQRMEIDGGDSEIYIGGTDLVVAVADDQTTTVTVNTGVVLFTNNLGGVVVREGQQSVARPGRAPTPPVAVNLPFIVQWAVEERPAVTALEPVFVSRDPARLQAALREAEALPAGAERWRRLGDVAHDQSELQEARQAYEAGLAALAPTAAAGERALLEARLGETLLELRELPAAEAAFRRSLALEPGQMAVRTGLVITLLNRGQNDLALAEARAAVEQDPNSASAYTALALAQIERGEPAAAEQSLQKALALDAGYVPALAWQSFLLRAAGRLDEAMEAARRAVAQAPRLALAWQSLSDAAFALDRTGEARLAAEQAVRLDPKSPGAFMSLVRARLQEGDVEGAAQAASEAVRLAPDVGRAQFFLGVALAEQRRLGPAAGALEEAVKLDPGDLEARAFLARVYIEQDKPGDAIRVAEEALSREGDFAPARAALGWVYWHAGKLREAVKEYRAALKVAPESLLYHLELARVYLDRNDLTDALAEALEAVHEVPGSSEAHAILGLVYDRQENRDQATREYTEAISLSPDNSLARLGLVTSFTPASFGFFDSGQERLVERAQALLRDPAVLEQTFKPGVTSEAWGSLGSNSSDAEQFLHRGRFLQGRLHDLSIANRAADDGYRANAGYHYRQLQTDLAAQATPSTQVLLQYLDQRLNGGLPGAVGQSDPDAGARRHRLDANLHVRQYLGEGTYLWLEHGSRLIRNLRTDPEAPKYRSDNDRRLHISEMRLDHQEGQHRFTYGLAALHESLRIVDDTDRGRIPGGEMGLRVDDTRESIGDFYEYIQDDDRLGDRGDLILGARWLRASDEGRHDVFLDSTLNSSDPISARHSDPLPYAMLTYSLDARDLIRVLAFRNRVRFDGPLLAPTEAFLVTEPINVNYNGRLSTEEIDYERRFSRRTFARLFFQNSQARQLYILPTLDQKFDSPSLTIPRVREQIAGLRLEQQITPYLSGFTTLKHVRAEDRTGNAYDPRGTLLDAPNSFRGLQVPLTPRWKELVGLSYVDRSGTKLQLTASVLSRQFMDAALDVNSPQFGSSGIANPRKRPSTGARTQFDLRIAKEPRVEIEYSLTVSNLFNTRIPDWPHFPRPGRLWMLSLALRF